jgi:hypothetical protein
MKPFYFLFLLISLINAFQISNPSCRFVSTSLNARRTKKQSLASIVEDGMISPPKRTKATKLPTNVPNKSMNTKKTPNSSISTDLEKWASSQGFDDLKLSTPTDNIKSARSTNDRQLPTLRTKQEDFMRDNESKRFFDDLLNALEGKNNLDQILSIVRSWVQLPSTSLKVLTAGANRRDYRLAWVGSDDAICHIGTGQHKVPLARLQEIFLTLEGRNRIQLYEVISLLGPFPNLRNTLQGSCQVIGSDNYQWKIVYDSMIDAMGKQLLADKEENKQRVDLEVLFCDKNAIIASIPSKTDQPKMDPFLNNGSKLLVFIYEEEMDSKLEALRAL